MDRMKGLHLLLMIVLASTSLMLVRQVTSQPLLPPILVPNCGTGPGALIANVSRVLQGSLGTILFSCGDDRDAIVAGRPGSAVPQFSLPSGYTSLKISTDPSCKSGIDLVSGSSVIFGTHIGGVPITDYNYCASFSDAPPGGLQSFTITWAEVTLRILIDIKPTSDPNTINIRRMGVIPVAVLTTATFDAAALDPATVRFGRTGTEAAPVHSQLEDVDNDGNLDLVFQFNSRDTGLRQGDTQAILSGRTFDGTVTVGTDLVRVL